MKYIHYLIKTIALYIILLFNPACTTKHHEHNHHEGHHHDEPHQKGSSAMIIHYLGSQFVVDKNTPGYTLEQQEIIQSLILKEKAQDRFKTYEDMMTYHTKIEIPGYGSSTGGFGDETALGQFTYFTVQLPLKNQYRVFLYRRDQVDSSYQYLDNFIMDTEKPPELIFATENDQLISQNWKGKKVRASKVSP